MTAKSTGTCFLETPLINKEDQWQIQDFSEVGAPTLQGRQDTILSNFPKNFKEF